MNRFEEVVRAKNKRTAQDNELLSVLLKTLENVSAERAGQPASYNDKEIYADVLAVKTKINEVVEGVSDEAALLAPEIFPIMKNNNELIKAGTRINWKGEVKRAAVDLYDKVDNNPDNAPTLWEDLIYKEDYRVIPEDITTGTAFTKGERGWWQGSLYESLIDNNVWTPDSYPSGWTQIN